MSRDGTMLTYDRYKCKQAYLSHVDIAIIPPPSPELVLQFRLMEGASQQQITRVAVGLGSAARSTSSTSKRKSSKIGIVRAGKNSLLPPLYYCQWTLSRPCRAPNLLESKFDCPGFFQPSNETPLYQCYGNIRYHWTSPKEVVCTYYTYIYIYIFMYRYMGDGPTIELLSGTHSVAQEELAARLDKFAVKLASVGLLSRVFT